jgi:DNA mismatch endonuclease (patch repair protein)
MDKRYLIGCKRTLKQRYSAMSRISNNKRSISVKKNRNAKPFKLICGNCKKKFRSKAPRRNLCYKCSESKTRNKCKCGCGLTVICRGARFIRGHNGSKYVPSRTPEQFELEKQIKMFSVYIFKREKSLVKSYKALSNLLKLCKVNRSLVMKQIWNRPNFRKKMSDVRRKQHTLEVIAKISASRSKQKFPFNNTKPERLVKRFLKQSKLRFRTQYRPDICKYHAFDFRLLDFKVLIEVDGCYWHGCRKHYPKKANKNQVEKEKLFKKLVNKDGWILVRLWEHDIKNNNFKKLQEVLA